MCGERLLMVDCSLHCAQDTFKVAPDAPDARLNGFGKPHGLKERQSFCAVPFMGSLGLTEPWLRGIPHYDEPPALFIPGVP
jgi:hypothetical protein